MDALLLLHLLQELFEPFVHVGIHVCKVGICTNIKSIILTFCTVFVQFLYSCGKKQQYKKTFAQQSVQSCTKLRTFLGTRRISCKKILLIKCI